MDLNAFLNSMKLTRVPAYFVGDLSFHQASALDYGKKNFHSKAITRNRCWQRNSIQLRALISIRPSTPICILIFQATCSSKQTAWRWQPPSKHAHLSWITNWWNGLRGCRTSSKSAGEAA